MKGSGIAKKVSVLLLACALAGCGTPAGQSGGDKPQAKPEASTTAPTEAKKGGELRIAYQAQPPTLDPHVTTSQASATIGRSIFETLVTVDSNYRIQPMLADSWEQSEDGKTLVFHLRKGVRFHNGKEMTADDVVASMNRWIQISSAGKDHFKGAAFEAKDAQTAILHLQQPTSTALPIMAYGGGNYPAIMPKELIDGADPKGVKEYVGTGPFQFKEWQQDQEIHLTKFADYQARSEAADGLAGKREALVDDLRFIFTPDSSTQVAGLLSGEYDVAADVSYDSVQQLETNSDIQVNVAPTGMLNLFFNKKKGLFTDVKARQAIGAGMDVESILIAAYTDEKYYQKNANMMMYYQVGQWASENGKELYNQNNPEKAKQLLKEAGYQGQEIKIVTSRDYEDMYNGAVALQQQMEKLGIKTKLEVYDWPTFTELRNDENKFDILVITNTPKPEPSSLAFMRKDFPGWTDSPELDKLLSEFRGAPNLEKAMDVYGKMQTWFYEYVPVVKVGDGNSISSSKKSVQNLKWLDGLVFWNVSNQE
ncbi:ABC transporter substrate-binding protein [Brevibacillus nitrificans]|uniref:ABC transporter substrate-binding protein n=1 Tax=Brevibacillus nitrificans TaxID=651560 RepID=UPI001FEA24CC|nr:ABC transporter substrate-binding protein [Brevibacillus nitrificans]